MKRLKQIRKPREILTLPEMLERTVINNPDSIALQKFTPSGCRKLSYTELYRLVKIRSDEILEKSIERGDRIALSGPNSFEWTITYLAIQFAGAIGVPLDYTLTETEIRHFLKDSGAKLLYTSLDEILDKIEISIPLEIPEKYKKNPDISTPDLSLDTPAVILYTSGTIDYPKGVVLSHRNLSSNVEMIYRTIEFYPGETIYALLPFHHIFPQTVGMLLPISVGATITLARSFKSREIREDCIKTKPVVLLVVPLILEKLIQGVENEIKNSIFFKKLGFKILDLLGKTCNSIKRGGGKIFYLPIRKTLGLENLRYLVSGGAPLSRNVSRKFEDWGFPILQGYGLTETSPVISWNPRDRPKNESVGLPMPEIELKIFNPGKDGTGEIAVRGNSVFKEYWNKPEETEEKFESGWFRTGDMGFLDSDSYLHITGRKKSIIVTNGGKNIYPEKIEDYLCQSPLIEEVLVKYEINTETGNKVLKAIIYPNYKELNQSYGDNNFINTDIYKIIKNETKRMNKHLAPYEKIRKIELRDKEFPKNTVQKIRRFLFE